MNQDFERRRALHSQASRTSRTAVVLVSAALGLAAPTTSQAQGASGGDVGLGALPRVYVAEHDFRSTVNGRAYRLWVSLPSGYTSQDTTRHPVLYMLDGAVTLPFAVAAYRLDNRFNDSLIIVGVGYSDGQAQRHRRVDFSLPSQTNSDSARVRGAREGTCCQADLMARVFREEIIPLIERNYRTQVDRGVIGNSAGGMFAAYALFSHPDLFYRYGIVSPSPWMDNTPLFEAEAAYSPVYRDVPKRVFVSVGSEENVYNQYTAHRLIATLRARSYATLHLDAGEVRDGTHGSASVLHAVTALYPPRGWPERYGDERVKQHARELVRGFLSALGAGIIDDIRPYLADAPGFQAVIGGRLVGDPDEYLAELATQRARESKSQEFVPLRAFSDRHDNTVIVALARVPDPDSEGPRERRLIFEVVKQADVWRIGYILHEHQAPPAVIRIRVEHGGAPVAGARVFIVFDADPVASAVTDSAGAANLAYDWRTTKRSGCLTVEATGFAPRCVAVPTGDSVVVKLSRAGSGAPP